MFVISYKQILTCQSIIDHSRFLQSRKVLKSEWNSLGFIVKLGTTLVWFEWSFVLGLHPGLHLNGSLRQRCIATRQSTELSIFNGWALLSSVLQTKTCWCDDRFDYFCSLVWIKQLVQVLGSSNPL